MIVCSVYWLMQSCEATRSAKSMRNICALYLIEFNRLVDLKKFRLIDQEHFNRSQL